MMEVINLTHAFASSFVVIFILKTIRPALPTAALAASPLAMRCWCEEANRVKRLALRSILSA